MTPPILVTMDSNEDQPKNKRPDACKYVIGQSQGYSWEGFAEQPVDMQLFREWQPSDEEKYPTMGSGDGWVCNVELKEISDFWASKNTGHLGQQIMTMISEPGFVAVFGSLDEVLKEVPKIKTDKAGEFKLRSQTDIISDVNTARALSADAIGCNVPIIFLSRNYERSFKWILSHAKSILTGPNMASWLPRFGCDPVGYGCLVSIPGIGDVVAKGLLSEEGNLKAVIDRCRMAPGSVQDIVIKGRKLGKAKASKLVEVFG
jgi:hypothetical protein